jgi:hypothetical protein
MLATMTGLSGCPSKNAGEVGNPNVEKTCDTANDGKQVTVVGFLQVPLMVDPCTDTCVVTIADTREYAAKVISLQIPPGTGPLSMKALPTELQFLQQVGAEYFTVTDSDGKPQPVGTRVRVTGTLQAKKQLIDPLDGKPKLEVLICTLRAASLRPF